MVTNLVDSSFRQNQSFESKLKFIDEDRLKKDECIGYEENLFRNVEFWKRKWLHYLNLKQNYSYYHQCLIQGEEMQSTNLTESDRFIDMLNEAAEQYSFYFAALKDRENNKELVLQESNEIENICEYCDTKISFNACCGVCGGPESGENTSIAPHPVTEHASNQESENVVTTSVDENDVFDEKEVQKSSHGSDEQFIIVNDDYTHMSSVTSCDDANRVTEIDVTHPGETDLGFELLDNEDSMNELSLISTGQTCVKEAPLSTKWTCTQCTFINDVSTTICKVCRTVYNGARTHQVTDDCTDARCWRPKCNSSVVDGKYCSVCNVFQHGDTSPGALLQLRVGRSKFTIVWQCGKCSHLTDALYDKCEQCTNNRLSKGKKECPICGWVNSASFHGCVVCDKGPKSTAVK